MATAPLVLEGLVEVSEVVGLRSPLSVLPELAEEVDLSKYERPANGDHQG